MRPKSTFYASDNLRRIYRERVGDSMTQAQFAKRYKIGGQSMIAQILSGAKALPIETAPKLADALRCTIGDICPEMDEFIRNELVPALGKALRRAAMVILTIGLFQFAPSDAYASTIYHNAADEAHFFVKLLNTIHIVRQWFSVRCRAAFDCLALCVRTHIFRPLRTA